MTRESLSRRRKQDGTELREIVSTRQGRREAGDGEPSPKSTYEAVTRQMVRSLSWEVRDIKHRINQLLMLLIGAILLEVLMRLIGVGV